MTSLKQLHLVDSWQQRLADQFDQDYMLKLDDFLQQERQTGKTIFPAEDLYFNALNSCPYERVRVVILGQDPYPTIGHAHGLCFSVNETLKALPKSLINIYKELKDDLKINRTNGNLQSWAYQGVLLLNSVLTVEEGKVASHQGKGWERFTDVIIKQLNDSAKPIVFVLWGAYAQKKGQQITNEQHLIIRSPHPSPLSAYRGFFASKPFSKINQFLLSQQLKPINWE